MEGTREMLRPEEMTLFIKGIYPFAFRYAKAARIPSGNNVHLCGPNGEELSQIYVLADKKSAGTLEEVPRSTQMRYMEEMVRADGSRVVAHPDEIKAALVQPEKEIRHVRIEPAQALGAEFVKSRYFIAAPGTGAKKKAIGGLEAYNLVISLLKENNYQIVFNGVEGGQARQFVIKLENDVAVMDVLCLDGEVLARKPFVSAELSADGKELKPMVATLMEQLKGVEMKVPDTLKLDVLEELFTAKAQGLPPKIVVEAPKEVTDMKALLKMAIEKK
jgi:hypothetical protein